MGAQNTQFQGRDRDVITFAQFDGLRNDVDPERFELGDLALGQNIDIDKTGRVARRDGYTSAVAGDTHSIWADEQQDVCMFVSGGVLRRMQPDFSSVAVKTLAAPISPMSYCRVSDRVYFSNGTDSGVYEAGAARSWGLPVAPQPQLAAAVGAMPPGTYQAAITWLRADGQESGCGGAAQIALPTVGGIVVTVPAAPQPDIVAAILYLTPTNGTTLLEATTITPGSTVSWASDPAALSSPLRSQFLSPPPAGQLVAHFRGHMFVAVGDTIFVSDPYGYELFNLRRYIQLDGRITMLAPLIDKDRTDDGRDSGFFVGTDRSTGVIAGANPDEFQYVPKVDYGVVAGAMCYVDATNLKDGAVGARKLPMWLSTHGICVGLPELIVNNLTGGKYQFPAGGRGAAVYIPGPNRFIATANL